MKKNVSGQVVGGQIASATDGSDFTGAVTAYVTGNGGTQAVGSVGAGACVHEGNGFHTYAPAQAETNYDHIAFTFKGTGAITATVQVYPAFPQTGDSYTRLGAPAGASLSADVVAIKSDTTEILIDTAVIGVTGGGLTSLASQASVNAMQADTDDIQSRLPAALSGGNMKVDVLAISGSAAAADNLEAHALRAVQVTFSGGTTTTAILVNVDGAAASSTNDVYNGRVLIFSAPAGLKDQACTITGYVGATKTATISAVTTAVGATSAAVMV